MGGAAIENRLFFMAERARAHSSKLGVRVRSSTRRRVRILCVAILCSALAAALISRPRPQFLWNSSPSSPRGLYRVGSANHLRVGDIVAAWPPRAARRLASARLYLPAIVPLVKPVAAAAGDRVCARSNFIFVNGRFAALRRERDPAGRPMPRWIGCHRLERSELFLLSRNAPLAFDGRYFGVTRTRDLIGRARLLWPR
jgi:conjugative transfer signal peptidase TraF